MRAGWKSQPSVIGDPEETFLSGVGDGGGGGGGGGEGGRYHRQDEGEDIEKFGLVHHRTETGVKYRWILVN